MISVRSAFAWFSSSLCFGQYSRPSNRPAICLLSHLVSTPERSAWSTSRRFLRPVTYRGSRLISLVVAISSSILTVLASSLAGFALAKYKFLGREFVFMLIISVLLIPLQVLMVPVFLILKSLGWINSLIGIIVPPAATATGTFMMRQYMIGIPDELLEAARIDGASDWKIYCKIILPLSAPVLGAVGILSFTWRWNDYLWPLIVINNQEKYTLQLSLANLIGTNTVEWGTLLAYATLAMIPVLIVFLCFQRYFLKGSLSGGVKG
jgi:alpha-1,4-digalacturonate transport system permease protein